MTIPKENITLLYEENTTVEGNIKKAGEIRKEKSINEIFRIIAEKSEDYPITTLENPFQTNFDTDFKYHVANTDKNGWIFLKSNSTDKNDSYVFAYNKKLSPDEETMTLFDKVQLKSFINGEVIGEQVISIQPYAIQAEGLNADGLTDNCKKYAIADENDLKIIYQVIQRKVANN